MSNKRKPRPAYLNRPVDVKRETVVIAYVHAGQTSAYFTTSLIGSLLYDRATSQHVAGVLNEWSSANISPARNELTRQFVDESGADWLLFIDSDMAWDVGAVDELIASADAEERPVVGGLCFGSSEGRLFPTIYQMTEVDGRPTTIRVGRYPDNEMVRCVATGAAFLLIHRSVIETIRDKAFNAAFPWFQETELAGKPAGEDLTFCLRAGLCGFPVYVNTAVKVGHHKSDLLTHDLFQSQQEAPS